jgi:hypothetical protein
LLLLTFFDRLEKYSIFRNKNCLMNIDGIKKRPISKRVQIRRAIIERPDRKPAIRSMDDIVRPIKLASKRAKRKALAYIIPLFVPKAPHQIIQLLGIIRPGLRKYVRACGRRFSAVCRQPIVLRRAFIVTIFGIAAISFGSGAYIEWSSQTSRAGADIGHAGYVLGTDSFVGPIASVDPDLALRSFLRLLDEEQSIPTAEDYYGVRKQKLKKYLASKRSPLAADDRVLDALLHTKNMKMILAISFVESNFARRCADNNCSGIGVEPGHPAWRTYKSLANWVYDFDKLLERRYKGWTPEEMRGVYVYPGSDNWVHGVKDVLTELKETGIE